MWMKLNLDDRKMSIKLNFVDQKRLKSFYGIQGCQNELESIEKTVQEFHAVKFVEIHFYH